MYPSLVRAKFYLQRSVDSCCDLAGYDKLSSSSYLLFFFSFSRLSSFFGGVRGRGERDLDFHHPLSPLFNILQYYSTSLILLCFIFCVVFFALPSSSCFFFLQHYFYKFFLSYYHFFYYYTVIIIITYY